MHGPSRRAGSVADDLLRLVFTACHPALPPDAQDKRAVMSIRPEDWQAIVQRMGSAFHEGRFEDGLTQALEEVSALLVQHFPLAPGAADGNELPDAPVLL